MLSWLFMCLIVIMFCAGFTISFPLCFPSEILIVYLLWPFFLQLHFMLIFTSLLRLILLFNFPWYFPEKSGTFCFIFRHISMDLFCLIFSVELSLLVILLFRWFIRLFIRYYSFIYSYISLVWLFHFIILVPYSFKLFSCLILSSCLAVLIYCLFRTRYFC